MQTHVQAPASTTTEQARQQQHQPEFETESAQLLRTPQFEDGRPEVTAQLHQQSLMANSQRTTQLQAIRAMMAASPRVQQLKTTQTFMAAGTLAKQNHQASVTPITQRMEDEEPLQPMAEEPVQREQTEAPATDPTPQDAPPSEPPKPNNTGLPDNLKSGIENLSGMSMDHVKVHYNSDKPAQLQAHAYAQGSEIHVAPGQEQHLPHEAWHVVQQAQGRVKPTVQMKSGVEVNDDEGLEREADVMGSKAVTSSIVQKISAKPKSNDSTVIQRVIKFGDKEAQERYDIAFHSVSTLASVIESLNGLGVDITIKVDDAKLGKDTFGAFYHDENMIRITSLARSRELFSGDKDDQINGAFASNLSHELTHALDYLLTQKKGAAEFRGRLGRNPDLSEIKAEQQAEDEKYVHFTNPKYSSNGGGVMRTEWRAWAIEAAATFEQVSKGKVLPKQFIGLMNSFLKGLTQVATEKDSVFYRKSQLYYDNHKATMMSEEGLASKDLDKFFTLKAVQSWLQEAEEIFLKSIQPFASKAAKDDDDAKESHMAAAAGQHNERHGEEARGSAEAVRDPIQIDKDSDIIIKGKGINKLGAKVKRVRREGDYHIYEYNEEKYKIHKTLTGHLDGADMSGSWLPVSG